MNIFQNRFLQFIKFISFHSLSINLKPTSMWLKEAQVKVNIFIHPSMYCVLIDEKKETDVWFATCTQKK